ncbi:MAG TPA: TolC family protein [Kofleriaceae bacterium]|jgi:outer membrane protein TolC|nr:TolC family protein [Kofleriaceae bacterium]
MVVRSIARVLVICSLVSAAAHADEPYEPPDFLKELPPLPAGVDASAVWRLDLAEVLRLAVHHNLGLAVERQSVEIARLGIDVARGEYEPAIRASTDHVRSDSPPLTAQAGTAGTILTTTSEDWSLSLTQRLPTGTQLELDFASGRLRSTAGTAVEPLNYLSAVTLSVTQPLLRGFSRDLVVPRIDVLRAEIASEHERQQLLVAAAQVVEQTEGAYWDLVLALYQYDLALRSRRLAEDQLALTHRQIEAGTTAPSDLISAESTLAGRKLALVSAEQQIELASDRLRGLIHLPRDQWGRAILPTELPRFVAETHRAEDMLEVALHNRPELAQVDLDLRAQELAVRKADNDKLPQINLGLSGSLVGQDAGYPGALGQVGRADAPSYNVTLNLSWTPLGRAAGAAAEIERAHQRVALATREQTLQDVWSAVRDAVRTQRSAALQVAAAARFRELATDNLDVEQRKFRNGNSSNFLVAQRQEELTGAQLSELSAVLTHKKATAALLRATGRLLDERHIELAVRRAP